MPVLKLVKASLVFIDPPFGFNVESWDTPEHIWPSDYWFEVLSSLQAYLKDAAAVVVFGDCFNVLPRLLEGVKRFNDYADQTQQPRFIPPIQICFQKLNHPHKSGNGYSQSIENAFVFHYKESPRVKSLDFEISGNLLSSTRVTGPRRIKNEKGEWINPCQKPHIWLKYFIQNNTTSESVVLDLTAGSFSSFLACFHSTHTLHWAGCDIGPDTLKNFDFLQKCIDAEELEEYFAGKSRFSINFNF